MLGGESTRDEGPGLAIVDVDSDQPQQSSEGDDFRAMACGRDGMSLAQKLHDEFLVCKICLEDFRNPKCLDCMHTFCEQCIETHVVSETSYKKYSDYREFTCPLCRKKSQMPFGGVRKLPSNHLINDLMSAVSRCRPLSHCLSSGSCDVCSGPISSSATAAAVTAARCLDCCKSLCARCAVVHREMSVTSRHSLYNPELVSSVLQDPDAMSCVDHRNETVGYYCADCEQCVCVLCTFDGVDTHRQHDIIDFNTAVARYEKSLRDQCFRATSEADRLQHDLDTLTACADDVHSVRQQIRATAEALRRQLDSQEATLLRRVDECKTAVDTRPALRDRVDRLNQISRRVQSVLEHGGVELLLLKKVISDQLETEERSAREQPTTGLQDAVWKALNFVPGSASVGELRERQGGRVQTARGSIRSSCSSDDCRCACHVPQTFVGTSVDHSTNTETRPALLDKAVNTKARGLMNGGGSGAVRRTARSTSVELLTVTTAHQSSEQLM